MVLGELDVDDFLGGSMKVDREAKAIEPIAKEIGESRKRRCYNSDSKQQYGGYAKNSSFRKGT